MWSDVSEPSLIDMMEGKLQKRLGLVKKQKKKKIKGEFFL